MADERAAARDVTGFVDLTTLGWPDLEVTAGGSAHRLDLHHRALRRVGAGAGWRMPPRTRPVDRSFRWFRSAANALLASFKVWNTATVGGNVCRSFAAGAMVSLAAGLDGVAVIWTPDGGERRHPVAELMTGNGTNSLGPGEVLRAVELPERALRSRALLRKIALAELGRSGAVVTGRIDEDGAAVFAVTAATLVPVVLRYDALPDPRDARRRDRAAPGYYTDPLGSADWRRPSAACSPRKCAEGRAMAA